MKLNLKLDELTIDSFDTTGSEKPKGTVYGEQCTCPTACTCPGCPTCDGTCPASCNETCDCFTNGGSCFKTECCPPETCFRTDCGKILCCV